MLVLHYFPDTASLVLRMVLAELEIPHDARRINREAGQLDSPGYRALHPLGKIPAMETPDGPMFETSAMLLWLSDRFARAALRPRPMRRVARPSCRGSSSPPSTSIPR